MNTMQALLSPTSCGLFQDFECGPLPTALGFIKLCGIDVTGLDRSCRILGLHGRGVRLNLLKPIKAKEDSVASLIDKCSRRSSNLSASNLKSNFFKPRKEKEESDMSLNDDTLAFTGQEFRQISTVGNSTNILGHEYPIQKGDRQQLLRQRGCVIWLTGLIGSGEYQCPVLNKVFTEYTHIIAVKTTGNVFCYEALKELNIKTKNWKELLTDELFTRDDIITIQNPNALDSKVLLDFDHIQKKLKVDDEEVQKMASDLTYNINVSGDIKQMLQELGTERGRETTLHGGGGNKAQKERASALAAILAAWSRLKEDSGISSNG